MAEVRLVDLEIIKRYSLAVRQEKAQAEDLLAALEASRATIEAAIAASSKSRSSRSAKPATDPVADALAGLAETAGDDPHGDNDVFGDFGDFGDMGGQVAS